VRYINNLIESASICTLSVHLLQAFADHGAAKESVDVEPENAALTRDRFARAGVDYEEMTDEVHRWSLAQSAAAFHEAVALIGAARDRLGGGSRPCSAG
jgi:transaldolase